MTNMKVLLIIAFQGFQPLEYEEPKKILQKAGVEVITGSDQTGTALSAIDKPVQVDIILDDVKIEDYDGVFFIGGPGALEHLDNEKSYRIIRELSESDKAWGAICISPRILAKAGVLENKKATGWNDDGQLDDILEQVGAEYVRQPVVADDKLVTGWGPDAAQEFGKAILKIL